MSNPEPPSEPTTALTLRTESAPAPALTAGTDSGLVAMWLHGRSPHTLRAYTADVDRFSRFVRRKALADVTLADLQGFAETLVDLRDSSRARTLNSVRSLLAFAERTGAIRYNVGAALRVPKAREALADRILSKREVSKLLKAAASPRDAALVSLLYYGGFRRSEVAALRWRDAADDDEGGAYLTVFGKGSKTRTVRVPSAVWRPVSELRGDAPADSPVFVGRSGALDDSAVWRIVRATARRAGLEKAVSPHFLRHSHASHALDKGAPIAVVRDTLGHASVATTDRYLHARPKESSGKYL